MSNSNYLMNQDYMSGGVYRAFIIKRSDSRVFIPGLCDKNILDSNGDISNEEFEKIKETLPLALYNSPEIEKLLDGKPTPCFVAFENGNMKRPIVMAYFGKGVKSVPGSGGSRANNDSSGDSSDSSGGSNDYADVTTSSGGNGNIVENAKKYLGVPYVWGGTSKAGVDCSGLTTLALKEAGISIPRTAADQYKCNSGTRVDRSQLQPGDLVFFTGSNGSKSNPGHVGIYVGNGQMVHAPSPGKTVRIVDMNTNYYKNSYVGAKRFK